MRCVLSVQRLSWQRGVCAGLDSSTTFLIVKCIRNFTKALEVSGMCNQELRPPIMDCSMPKELSGPLALSSQCISGAYHLSWRREMC